MPLYETSEAICARHPAEPPNNDKLLSCLEAVYEGVNLLAPGWSDRKARFIEGEPMRYNDS